MCALVLALGEERRARIAVTSMTPTPDPALKGKVVKGAAPEKKKLPPDSVLVAASLHFPLHRLTRFILLLEFLFQR